MQDILLVAGTLVICLVAMLMVAVPIASVAETFEYDVVRYLNNPFVLKGVQKHFGQQFLPHLKALDWGFRLGGSVISLKMVASVATGLAVTIAATVTQAIMARVSDLPM